MIGQNNKIIWPTEKDVIIRNNQALATIKYLIRLGKFSSLAISIIYIMFRELIIPNLENLFSQRIEVLYHTISRLKKTIRLSSEVRSEISADPETEENSVQADDINISPYTEQLKFATLSDDYKDMNGLQASIQTMNENMLNLQYKSAKDIATRTQKSKQLVSDLREIKGSIIKMGFS